MSVYLSPIKHPNTEISGKLKHLSVQKEHVLHGCQWKKKILYAILKKILELLKAVPGTPLENYNTILSVIPVIPKAVTQNWSVRYI